MIESPADGGSPVGRAFLLGWKLGRDGGTMTEGGDGSFGVDVLSAVEPAVPRRPHRRGPEPGVQAACRRVLTALEGLGPSEQLRVLRAAALLLGPDEPPA